MKKIFIIILTLSLFLPGLAQKRAIVSKEKRNTTLKMRTPALEGFTFKKEINPTVKADAFPPEEEQIGWTRYDDQANASIQNRIYMYDDGTIGATWTRAMEDGTWSDRGTGYNYFDGNSWGDFPEIQVEEERTGWPSYSPWGENGEIIFAHGSDGLVISSRTEKGTGDWAYSTLQGPPDHEYMIWNRAITSGEDNTRVHAMAVTASTVYNGTPYEGLNGALLYSMSTDGGTTWEIENAILDGMGSENYMGYDGDTYTFAQPEGDIVAFVVGESWYDLFLMKSTDGGQTFTKTVIWDHPYPFFDTQAPIATDTFYCVDGSQSCVIDINGKVHVAFGINRAISDGTDMLWFPYVDGIGYWNEDMPTFSNNLNALSPYGDPGSELVEDYNLIGWSQDVNNNGTLDFAEDIGTYYVSLSSFPQLVYDENNHLCLIYSSVTETYDNGTLNYRHLWARASTDGGLSWGEFFDLSSELIHIFDECVYPSCAANSDEYIHLIYQTDNEPGCAIWGTTHAPVDNKIVYMKVLKDDITGINENSLELRNDDVSQNYPNPFNSISTINVNLRKSSVLSLSVSNLMGQRILDKTIANAQAGLNKLTIDAAGYIPGVYFYTVTAGAATVTKKMIVE